LFQSASFPLVQTPHQNLFFFLFFLNAKVLSAILCFKGACNLSPGRFLFFFSNPGCVCVGTRWLKIDYVIIITHSRVASREGRSVWRHSRLFYFSVCGFLSLAHLCALVMSSLVFVLAWASVMSPVNRWTRDSPPLRLERRKVVE
jgi:hypothetical protein